MVYAVGSERPSALVHADGLHPHLPQKLDEVAYVQNVRYVRYHDLPVGQQHCADDFQRLVFCTLGGDFSAESVPALYYE